ncbi:MAG: HAMP domain-containing protein [Azospirillum sp.]|nr:HAMP domain-containing protein [Azospirillum sp.]
MRGIPFGVAHRVTAALLAISLLSLLATAIALYGVGRFRDGFDRIAVKQLADLVNVSKLVQQSEAIAVTAPRLVAVGDRFEHSRAMQHVNDLFRLLDAIFETLSKGGISPAVLDGIARHRALMTDNLEKLNRIVADRIVADHQFSETLKKIDVLAEDAHLRQRDSLDPNNPEGGDTARRLRDWAVFNNQSLITMLLATTVSTPSALERLAGEFHSASQDAEAVLASLPNAVAGPWLALSHRAAALAEGDRGVFVTRRSLIGLQREMQGALHQTNVLTGQFIAAVSNLFADVQSGIERERGVFERLLANGAQILLAIIAISLLASAVIYVYLRRRVINRLLMLRHCMRARAEGRTVSIPDEGDDELAEMGRALTFFVSEIGRREHDLRAAKEAAETAYLDLKTTQQQLIEAEKLAGLGSLVAGVAHEINTPIGVALTAASHLADDSERTAQRFASGQLRKSDFESHLRVVGESSRMVLTSIERASALIQSFKEVAADQTSGERRAIELRGYIEEIVLSLGPRIRATPHQVTVKGTAALEADTYPGAIAQVLTQLIVNALVHAFDDDRPGAIEIVVQADDDGLVALRCADNGRGIATDHLARIFDPFFTTRRNAGGIGLGLHLVYNLVTRRLRGRITVASLPGEGTTFLVRFPRVPTVVAPSPEG